MADVAFIYDIAKEWVINIHSVDCMSPYVLTNEQYIVLIVCHRMS